MPEDITLDEAKEIGAAKKFAMEQPIGQESELTGVMRHMNEDKLEGEERLPSIDMKTRLHPLELSNIIIHDAVVALNCLPKDCLITTRTKKRLAVSLHGLGREEMVKIVSQERERQSGGGFMDKVKNLFTPVK